MSVGVQVSWLRSGWVIKCLTAKTQGCACDSNAHAQWQSTTFLLLFHIEGKSRERVAVGSKPSLVKRVSLLSF